MTPSGIEPATLRLVAQRLNHLRSGVSPFTITRVFLSGADSNPWFVNVNTLTHVCEKCRYSVLVYQNDFQYKHTLIVFR